MVAAKGTETMLAALEINFARWGMIVCAGVKLMHMMA